MFKTFGNKECKMLPDGNGDCTRLMGMPVRKENLGFGLRSWRYSMHVVNGEIKHIDLRTGFCTLKKVMEFRLSQ